MKTQSILDPILQYNPTKLELGAVYTPSILSHWVADTLIKYMKNSNKKILDPASGDGALLEPLSNICENDLIAVDINKKELLKVSKKIKSSNVSIRKLDTLKPSDTKSTLKFWKEFFLKNDIGGVISNPPWGSNIWQTSTELQKNGLSLASGQYDSYELFIETMIKAADTDVFFAFIIPDSIFLSEHRKLRELILRTCKIHEISRLGEGFFDKVYRGTCVLILEKSTSTKSHMVKCMRLNKDWRTNVLLKNISFQDACSNLCHYVKQDRFKSNNQQLFDIDILETETTVDKIEALENINWMNYFKSGRGVEVAKSGKVVICSNCKTAHPVPRKKDYVICSCKYKTQVSDISIKSIISDKYTKGSVPLIVGEDIKRNICSPKRYIMKNIKGVNYKNEKDFSSKKLLIRKTGIGVKASIDMSGSLTNQVVFHYILKDEENIPSFMLEYVQGILSSRVLMAYYLQKYGDNEWRTHPYITQKIIAQLPIPDVVKNKKNFNLAKQIAELVKKQQSCNKKDLFFIDMQIERLVVSIFSLTEKDCKWVLKTLQGAQQLEPIRTLMIDNYTLLLKKEKK